MIQVDVQFDTTAIVAAATRFTGPALSQLLTQSLERRAKDVQRAAVRTFASRGIGRRIFGRKDSGAYKLITVSPPEQTGDGARIVLTAKGLAAIQETGGRIRPHVILPGRGKALAFARAGAGGFGGDLVFARVVHHPGATMPQHPALVPEAQKVPALVLADMRAAIEALWAGAAA